MRLIRFLPLLFLLPLMACSTGKVSTTSRTAVEKALLSEAAELALHDLDDPHLSGKTFFIDTSEFEAVDEEYILSTLRLKLLHNGMRYVDNKADADIIVFPRSGVANIDQSEVLIGIPSLPITAPGLGAVELPEFALYKRVHQKAHHKTGLYAIDGKDHSLVFDFDRVTGSRYYTRWTIMMALNFRTTDLPRPYKKRDFEVDKGRVRPSKDRD